MLSNVIMETNPNDVSYYGLTFCQIEPSHIFCIDKLTTWRFCIANIIP